MGFPKSLRSIEIEQKCSFGFTDAFVEKLLSDKKDTIKRYAWIKHDKENDDHIHLMLWFHNPQPTDALLKWIDGVGTVSQLERIKKDESAIAYLTHANRPEKFQYGVSNVHSNIPVEELTAITENQKLLSNVKPIIDKIVHGELTERDIFSIKYADIYLKHKKTIDNAFDFYYESIRNDIRKGGKEMEVAFLVGKTGTGKTSYAKWFCEQNNLTYCVSSGSNDVLQDYKGEDVLILDDFRDSCFRLADVLKLLDNHTRTSVNSRYRNKMFAGDFIIITTSIPLDDWYSETKGDSREQFLRRIGTVLEFNDDTVVGKAHANTDTSEFVCVASFTNEWSAKFRKAEKEKAIPRMIKFAYGNKGFELCEDDGFVSVEEVSTEKQIDIEEWCNYENDRHNTKKD